MPCEAQLVERLVVEAAGVGDHAGQEAVDDSEVASRWARSPQAPSAQPARATNMLAATSPANSSISGGNGQVCLHGRSPAAIAGNGRVQQYEIG